jgi:peptide/nickel transport system permease protein
MISEAKTYVFFSPWLVNIPGFAILALLLGMNLLGDGLRNLIAPGVRT